ncbi:MAG: CoA pyrophosphatase [Chloroflexi bacterium]|nr:CoA pyrophosphatase [Chloroflexota bacterium]MCI0845780.1 CoA pyrophosphatase [Chloroflexota bacterium]
MASSPPEIVKEALAQRVAQTLADPSLTPAAVLLTLYSKDGEYCILLHKRSEQVEYHKGEISFPGGTQDKEDRDPLDTALRETEEEMGILREDVTILGELDEVATNSGFLIRVYVGTIEYPYPFKPSNLEIAEVLEVPIAVLQDPANRRAESRWDHGQLTTSYAYAYKDHLIFGATARILQQFLELLATGKAKEGD